MILSWFCLDICNKTGLLSQDFDCQVAGFAQKYVTGWPFYRSHNCAYKNAVIEVLNTSDFVPSPKWLTASTTAHEIAHLIGNTEHDGEEEFYGGGPGGEAVEEELDRSWHLEHLLQASTVSAKTLTRGQNAR